MGYFLPYGVLRRPTSAYEFLNTPSYSFQTAEIWLRIASTIGTVYVSVKRCKFYACWLLNVPGVDVKSIRCSGVFKVMYKC